MKELTVVKFGYVELIDELRPEIINLKNDIAQVIHSRIYSSNIHMSENAGRLLAEYYFIRSKRERLFFRV